MLKQLIIETAPNFRPISLQFIAFFLLLSFTVVLPQMFAQSAGDWKYIAGSAEGKYYVKQSVTKLSNGNHAHT